MARAIIIRIVKVMAFPVAYALLMRQLFVVDDWEQMFSVMSLSFLFCVPVIVGALTVYTSREEEARRIYYRIFAPWVPVAIFLVITITERNL